MMLSSLFNIPSFVYHAYPSGSQRSAFNTRRRSRRLDRACNATSFLMSDQGDAYTLSLRLPELLGRQLSDVELYLEDDVLTLQVPELIFAIDPEQKPLWEEIPSGSLKERFRIPSVIDAERISATLEGDVLRVHLPKRTPVKHTIHINSNIAG